jgi:hypothetical protein
METATWRDRIKNAAWWKWFTSSIKGGWYLVFPGATAIAAGDDHLLDTRRIILVMQPIILLGVIALICDCPAHWARAFLWAAACLSVGFFAGFLFGIPKVLQGERTNPTPATKPPTGYRQRVNTNLEEISDWLTKIIVGLGLYELKKVPSWLDRLAAVFAASVDHKPEERGVLGGAVVFFFVSGFLLGYLVTRLYLQGALGRADRAAVPDEGAAPKLTEADQAVTAGVADADHEKGPDSQPAKKDDPNA